MWRGVVAVAAMVVGGTAGCGSAGSGQQVPSGAERAPIETPSSLPGPSAAPVPVPSVPVVPDVEGWPQRLAGASDEAVGCVGDRIAAGAGEVDGTWSFDALEDELVGIVEACKAAHPLVASDPGVDAAALVVIRDALILEGLPYDDATVLCVAAAVEASVPGVLAGQRSFLELTDAENTAAAQAIGVCLVDAGR